MEKYSDGRYYYAATTPGFSAFAVTRKGAGAPTTTPTLDFAGHHHPAGKYRDPRPATTTRPVISRGSHETGDCHHDRTTGSTGNITGVSRIWIIFGAAGITAFVLTITLSGVVDPEAEPGLFRKYD